jgi:hypothetical protein
MKRPGPSHGCCLGQTGQHIHNRRAPRSLLEAWLSGGDPGTEAAEQLVLQAFDPFLGVQDPGLVLLQFRCDEPLAVGDGLLAMIILGDAVQVRPGDLDEVTEHFVEPDLQ